MLLVDELGVYGDQIVLAADLQAMAGIENQCQIVGAQRACKGLEALQQRRAAQIETQGDAIAERFQAPGDVARVVGGVGERRGVAVGAVADDKGVTAGERGCGQCAEQNQGGRREVQAFAAHGAGAQSRCMVLDVGPHVSISCGGRDSVVQVWLRPALRVRRCGSARG